MAQVDSADIQAYARDGAVVLRGIFTPEQVELVRAGVTRNLAEPGPLAAVASDESDAGRFIEDFCNWQRIPEYEEFIRTSPAADIARQLMQ
ncbi:MAG: phytanoyl-CoA dioxygenase, partial [Actinomycetales bacterium mxb001]